MWGVKGGHLKSCKIESVNRILVYTYTDILKQKGLRVDALPSHSTRAWRRADHKRMYSSDSHTCATLRTMFLVLFRTTPE